MKRFDRFTPDGTKDLVFAECERLLQAENKLREAYGLFGYREVKTPSIEFFDTVSNGVGKIPQSELYTLTDSNGRLLAMRPESTKPIARLLASRLQNKEFPIRIFYNQPVFRRNLKYNRKQDEFVQSGIELLGAAGGGADKEVLLVAVRALQALFGDQFYFEIGHMQMVQMVLQGIQSKAMREAVRAAVASKNYPDIERLAEELGEEGGALLALSKLFGGAEVLDEAEALFPACQSVVAQMRELFLFFEQNGLGNQIMIDFCVLHDYDYYTGLVFKGYVKGEGAAILTGGRYDSLYGDYDLTVPAIGFAIELSRAAAYQTLPTGKGDILLFDDLGDIQKLEAVQRAYVADGFVPVLVAKENAVNTVSAAYRALQKGGKKGGKQA